MQNDKFSSRFARAIYRGFPTRMVYRYYIIMLERHHSGRKPSIYSCMHTLTELNAEKKSSEPYHWLSAFPLSYLVTLLTFSSYKHSPKLLIKNRRGAVQLRKIKTKYLLIMSSSLSLMMFMKMLIVLMVRALDCMASSGILVSKELVISDCLCASHNRSFMTDPQVKSNSQQGIFLPTCADID